MNRRNESGTENSSWLVKCPCCTAQLRIDRATGSLLETHQPRAKASDLEALLDEEQQRQERAAEVFEQERASLAQRERLLESKFERALEEAKSSTKGDDDERPLRPIDL